MAQTFGRVISIEKDGWAQIITRKDQSCKTCTTTKSCCSGHSRQVVTAKVVNKAGAKTGDMVSISLDTGKVLKNAALIYLIPVAGLMTGALLGDSMADTINWSPTSSAIGLGFMGLAVGFTITAIISKLFTLLKRNVPVIEEITSTGNNMNLYLSPPGFDPKSLPGNTTSMEKD